MSERSEKLSIEVEVKGHDAAAKDVESLKRETTDLTKEVVEEGKALEGATGDASTFALVLGGLLLRIRGVIDVLGAFGTRAIRTTDRLRDLGGWVGHAAAGFGSLVSVVKKSTNAFVRHIPALIAVYHGIKAVVGVLKDEIAERLRLIEVMKLQSQAGEEHENKQLSQKQRLERIAGRRGVGGFETADAARLAQVRAARAKEQFSDLDDADIEKAVGLFGDVPGVTQEQLTKMAIVASFGELDDVKATKIRSRATLGRIIERKSDRFGERIDTFARVETRQGDGMGWGQFRTGQPTERASRLGAERAAPSGGQAETRRRLRELLGPEMSDEELERAVYMYGLFGSAEALESARVSTESSRPVTALWNVLKIRPTVEVGLPDQPGFGSEALGLLGGTKTFARMGMVEYENLRSAFEQIGSESHPGAGMSAVQGGERGAGGTTNIHNDHRQYIYNPRNYGNDAASRKGRTTNGETLLRDME